AAGYFNGFAQPSGLKQSSDPRLVANTNFAVTSRSRSIFSKKNQFEQCVVHGWRQVRRFGLSKAEFPIAAIDGGQRPKKVGQPFVVRAATDEPEYIGKSRAESPGRPEWMARFCCNFIWLDGLCGRAVS